MYNRRMPGCSETDWFIREPCRRKYSSARKAPERCSRFVVEFLAHQVRPKGVTRFFPNTHIYSFKRKITLTLQPVALSIHSLLYSGMNEPSSSHRPLRLLISRNNSRFFFIGDRRYTSPRDKWGVNALRLERTDALVTT